MTLRTVGQVTPRPRHLGEPGTRLSRERTAHRPPPQATRGGRCEERQEARYKELEARRTGGARHRLGGKLEKHGTEGKGRSAGQVVTARGTLAVSSVCPPSATNTQSHAIVVPFAESRALDSTHTRHIAVLCVCVFVEAKPTFRRIACASESPSEPTLSTSFRRCSPVSIVCPY